MKKLINDPLKVTDECIEGFTKAYSRFLKKADSRIVLRKDAPIDGKVGIVVGGGSGHEPEMIGFVGPGMADAAVLGEVFAAPAPLAILKATKIVNANKGVLYIYGNYAGDNMNFDMAANMAAEEGIKTETVRVWDDVASAPPENFQERRGLVGDLFVTKIAGAKAETKATLEDVKRVAEKARDNCRTYAAALSPGTIPATGRPTFTIGDDEMYFGVGAHGEKGVQKTKLKTADETASILVEGILKDMPLQAGDEVCVIVNGYGSTTLMELSIINRKVHQILEEAEIKIYDTLMGNFLTTQEMAGVSVTLMKLDAELKELYEAPCLSPVLVKCRTY